MKSAIFCFLCFLLQRSFSDNLMGMGNFTILLQFDFFLGAGWGLLCEFMGGPSLSFFNLVDTSCYRNMFFMLPPWTFILSTVVNKLMEQLQVDFWNTEMIKSLFQYSLNLVSGPFFLLMLFLAESSFTSHVSLLLQLQDCKKNSLFLFF